MPARPGRVAGGVNSVKVPPGVIRPMVFDCWMVNHRLRSGPVAMARGFCVTVVVTGGAAVRPPGSVNAVRLAPFLPMRPMLPEPNIVNHRFLSGPRVMPEMLLAGMPTPKGFAAPRGLPPCALMAPTSLALVPRLPNHMLLSPLFVKATGTLPFSPLGNQSVAGLNDIDPSARWNLPICFGGAAAPPVACRFSPASVNHRLPSGPTVRPRGSELEFWMMPGRLELLNSVIVPVAACAAGVRAPMGAMARRDATIPRIVARGISPAVRNRWTRARIHMLLFREKFETGSFLLSHQPPKQEAFIGQI